MNHSSHAVVSEPGHIGATPRKIGGVSLAQDDTRDDAALTERLDFLILLSGGAALAGVGSRVLLDKLQRDEARVEFVPLNRQYLHLAPLVGVA